MDPKANALNWFEIGVSDFERAKKFYESVFGIEMPVMDFGPVKMGMFPSEPNNGKVGGAICKSEFHKTGAGGGLIYLNGNPDLAIALSKVEAAGGKVLMPKQSIGEFGFSAVMLDTEGNAVALHSNK